MTNKQTDYRNPRWWQFLIAGAVDLGIAAAGFFAPFVFFIAVESSNSPFSVPNEWKFAVKVVFFIYIMAFCLLFIPLYAPIFHASRLRATIGKVLAGLYVVDTDGEKLSFKQALFRQLSFAQHAGSVHALQEAARSAETRSRF